MQWKVYFDRPQATILDYLDQVDGFIAYAYPNWGQQ